MSRHVPVIEVEGLTLRLPEPADIPWVHEACQDPEIARFTEVPQPYEAHHAVGFVTGASDEWWRYVITETETGELHGAIALKWFDEEARRGEVGYWLAAGSRGQGVLTRALRGIEEAAARHLGATEIVLRIADANTPSLAVAHRNGYEEADREPAACRGFDAIVFTKRLPP